MSTPLPNPSQARSRKYFLEVSRNFSLEYLYYFTPPNLCSIHASKGKGWTLSLCLLLGLLAFAWKWAEVCLESNWAVSPTHRHTQGPVPEGEKTLLKCTVEVLLSSNLPGEKMHFFTGPEIVGLLKDDPECSRRTLDLLLSFFKKSFITHALQKKSH